MALALIFGRNVRRFREARNLTIEQLAHDTKLSYSYVGEIERGRRNPSLAVVERIASALEIEPVTLLQK